MKRVFCVRVMILTRSQMAILQRYTRDGKQKTEKGVVHATNHSVVFAKSPSGNEAFSGSVIGRRSGAR